MDFLRVNPIEHLKNLEELKMRLQLELVEIVSIDSYHKHKAGNQDLHLHMLIGGDFIEICCVLGEGNLE